MKLLIEVNCHDGTATAHGVATLINRNLSGLAGFINAKPAGSDLDLIHELLLDIHVEAANLKGRTERIKDLGMAIDAAFRGKSEEARAIKEGKL